MNDVAKKEIEALLERYRVAYAARDFAGVQRAFPTAHNAIRDQFKSLKSLKYEFAGAPKYKQLDAFTGTAVIELGSSWTMEQSLGKKTEVDWVETIDLVKRGADNQWIINSVSRTRKE